jgi:hypothetical protein
MAAARRGRRRWTFVLVAALAAATGWAAYRLLQADADIAPRTSAANPPHALAPGAAVSRAQVAAVAAQPGRPADAHADPLGSAPDLRRLYDQYAGSADPRQRRIAARAFGACVPAFLPSAGQAPSPEPLIQALPAAQRGEREAAYRTLFARCSRFMDEGRAELTAAHQAMQRDVDVREPGMRAMQAMLAGRIEEADRAIREATTGGDPAAIEALSGLAVRIARERNPDQSDAALVQVARAVDAALPAVACDLGLDCSATSLWSVQLCATEGRCQGDLLARLAARNESDAVDPALLQQQRQRMLVLLRSGRALGVDDLLP